MEPLQQADNVELLATLAGPSVATALLEQYGELSRLAQASCDELQRVQGLDAVKATLIKAAFLLAQRLTGESAAALPVPELQEAGPAVSRPLPAAIPALPRSEPPLDVRSLQIEAEGDPWKGPPKPKIRLMGRWLENAGFPPGLRVQVLCLSPGRIELRAPEGDAIASSEEPF